jgi:hypothetical protein
MLEERIRAAELIYLNALKSGAGSHFLERIETEITYLKKLRENSFSETIGKDSPESIMPLHQAAPGQKQ